MPPKNDSPYLTTSPLFPDVGDIFAAHVSASDPIVAIIKEFAKDDSKKKQASLRSKATNASILSRKEADIGRDARPVIVTDVSLDSELKICIIATFDGQDPLDPPPLLERFLVPIYTTSGDEKHLPPPHLHTIPTWHCDNPAWVIAYPFPVGEEMLKGRWVDTKINPSTNYTADLEVLGILKAMATEAADEFAELESPDQNKEIEAYWVSLLFLADEDKHSNSLSALGG